MRVKKYSNVFFRTYSKIEKGTREVTVKELQKMAGLFHLFIFYFSYTRWNLP